MNRQAVAVSEQENLVEGPIFDKGVNQALYWGFALEGVDPHEKSVHARLIEKMDDGYLQPFHVQSIHHHLGLLDMYAFSAQIRMWAESSCKSDLQLNVLWSVYGDVEVVRNDKPLKLTALHNVARYISSSFRMSRGRVIDLLGYCLATETQRAEVPIEYISDRHGMTVYHTETDIIKIENRLGALKKSFLGDIRREFRRRGLIS